MWDDDRLDRAIDETAREMTTGEPRADFRSRVLARIEAGSGFSVRVSAFRLWRPAFATLAVAASIVIVVFMSRDRQQPESRVASVPAPAVRRKADPTYKKAGPGKPDATYRPAVRLPPSPPSGYGGPRKADTTYDRSESNLSDIDSLAPPSIELEPIAVAALADEQSIRIEPLPPVAPIAVAPLGVENEGDRR